MTSLGHGGNTGSTRASRVPAREGPCFLNALKNERYKRGFQRKKSNDNAGCHPNNPWRMPNLVVSAYWHNTCLLETKVTPPTTPVHSFASFGASPTLATIDIDEQKVGVPIRPTIDINEQKVGVPIRPASFGASPTTDIDEQKVGVPIRPLCLPPLALGILSP